MTIWSPDLAEPCTVNICIQAITQPQSCAMLLPSLRRAVPIPPYVRYFAHVYPCFIVSMFVRVHPEEQLIAIGQLIGCVILELLPDQDQGGFCGGSSDMKPVPRLTPRYGIFIFIYIIIKYTNILFIKHSEGFPSGVLDRYVGEASV